MGFYLVENGGIWGMGDKKVKKIYDNLSKIYDQQRVKDYFQNTLKTVLKYIQKSKSKILDIGCGTGMYAVELSNMGYNVIGTDFSEDMIKKAKINAKKNKSKANFFVHDAEKQLPKQISKVKFDLILFNSSWEFLPNPTSALKILKNNLKDKGIILIITPNPLVSPAIILAEKLKIKKLSPAFYFFNSFKFRTKKFAKKAELKLVSYKYRYKFLDVEAVIKR